MNQLPRKMVSLTSTTTEKFCSLYKEMKRKYLLKYLNNYLKGKKKKNSVETQLAIKAWSGIALHHSLFISPFYLSTAPFPTLTDFLHCHTAIFLYSTCFCNKKLKQGDQMGKQAQFVFSDRKKLGRKKVKWEIKNYEVFCFLKFKISLSSTVF